MPEFELFLTLHGERPSLIDYTALICPHSRLRAGVWPRGVEVALDDTEPHVIAHLGFPHIFCLDSFFHDCLLCRFVG